MIYCNPGLACLLRLHVIGVWPFFLSSFSPQRTMHRAIVSAILFISVALAQSEGVAGCGGSIRVSQGILKYAFVPSSTAKCHRKEPEFLRYLRFARDFRWSSPGVDGVQSAGILLPPHLRHCRCLEALSAFQGEYELTVSKKDGWYVSPESFHVCSVCVAHPPRFR